MNAVKSRAVRGFLTVLCLTLLQLSDQRSASAGQNVTGRWANDPSNCTSFGMGPSLVIGERSLRWHDDDCRIMRVYKTGETIHIQAMCWSLSGERSIPVSLRPHGGMLSVVWDRARHDELRRCR